MTAEITEESIAPLDQESFECRMCFVVPPEQLDGDVSACRVLTALKTQCTPANYEAAVIIMSKASEGPFKRGEMADFIGEATDTKRSAAMQRISNASNALKSLFGDEVLIVKGAGNNERSYQLDPTVISRRCESGDILVKNKAENRSSGRKKQVLPVSFRNYDFLPGLVACIENYVLKGEDDDIDLGIQQDELIRSTIFEAIKSRGPVITHASVFRGLKNVLSEKTVSDYGKSEAARARFALVSSIVHRATANL